MRKSTVHPWPVRLCHWLNVPVMIGMVMSGWGIYNADPLFGFSFPQKATLGGWLGGNIAWHLAVMWVLGANGLIYLSWGVLSGHFRRRFFPLTAGALGRDISLAFGFRLPHHSRSYNAVQKLMYLLVLLAGILLVLSGLSIWKPVQFSSLVALMGGFAAARYVHFFAMSTIVVFVCIHVLMVILVPKTLPAMITGGQVSPENDPEQPHD